MKVNIRLARKEDLSEYTKLLQAIYQDAYVNEVIGLTKECFSQEVFTSKRIQDYLKSNLKISNKQKTWLAILGRELIGSITIQNMADECELKGFYVKTKCQGKGVGRRLWKDALSFANEKDIVLDIYRHNKKTIDIYKKWGFKIDAVRGNFFRHWPE